MGFNTRPLRSPNIYSMCPPILKYYSSVARCFWSHFFPSIWAAYYMTYYDQQCILVTLFLFSNHFICRSTCWQKVLEGERWANTKILAKFLDYMEEKCMRVSGFLFFLLYHLINLLEYRSRCTNVILQSILAIWRTGKERNIQWKICKGIKWPMTLVER